MQFIFCTVNALQNVDKEKAIAHIIDTWSHAEGEEESRRDRLVNNYAS